LSSPLSHHAIILTLFICIFCLGIFCFKGTYTRKEQAPGVVVPSRGVIRIIPKRDGIIQRIHFKVGNSVVKGDSLFTVNTDKQLPEGTTATKSAIQKIEQTKTAITKQQSNAKEEAAFKTKRLQSQIQSLEERVFRVGEQIDTQIKAVELEKNLLKNYKNLFNQEAASSLELNRQEKQHLIAIRTLQVLSDEKENFQAEKRDKELQIDSIKIATQKELSLLEEKLSFTEQSLNKEISNEKFIIQAPVSGQIASIIANHGQSINNQQALATLLPEGTRLEVKLYISPKAIGFIKSGQKVKLRYESFPYQKFGSHEGKITDISSSVVLAKDLDFPIIQQKSAFVATVEIEKDFFIYDGQIISLQPGMISSTDIILENRKIWEWILEPLISLKES